MSKTLYVSSGRKEIDLREVEDLFASVGDVENAHIEVLWHPGGDRGFGVFEMSTEQQANDCAERFHGHPVSDQVLSVHLLRPVPRVIAAPSLTALKRKTRKRNK